MAMPWAGCGSAGLGDRRRGRSPQAIQDRDRRRKGRGDNSRSMALIIGLECPYRHARMQAGSAEGVRLTRGRDNPPICKSGSIVIFTLNSDARPADAAGAAGTARQKGRNRSEPREKFMDISKIPVGQNAPWDVNVIIEIPMGGEPIKYEVDKASGALFVDRFLHTAMYYPCNYGFLPHTLSDDGDPCDMLVVGRRPIQPGAVLRSRPIGVLIIEDEAGLDEKVLAVPVNKLHPFYSDVQSYKDLPEILL